MAVSVTTRHFRRAGQTLRKKKPGALRELKNDKSEQNIPEGGGCGLRGSLHFTHHFLGLSGLKRLARNRLVPGPPGVRLFPRAIPPAPGWQVLPGKCHSISLRNWWLNRYKYHLTIYRTDTYIEIIKNFICFESR
jgi:hypothetical protein